MRPLIVKYGQYFLLYVPEQLFVLDELLGRDFDGGAALVGDVDLIFDLLEALVIIVVFGGAIGMPPRCRKVQVFLESFEYLDLEHFVILVEIGRWLDDLDTSII